jgi:hypothetical protein
MVEKSKDESVTEQQLANFRRWCRRLRRLLCDVEGQIALLDRALKLRLEASDSRWDQYQDQLRYILSATREALSRFECTGKLAVPCIEAKSKVDGLLPMFRSISESVEASGRKLTLQLEDTIARTLYLTDFAIEDLAEAIERYSDPRQGGTDEAAG